MKHEKKKVLVWGIGNALKLRLEMLENLISNECIEITAFVSKESKETEILGFPVIKMEQIPAYTYDMILIAAHEPAASSIIKDTEKMGIPAAILEKITDYMPKTIMEHECIYQQILKRQGNILKEILEASDEETADYGWMRQRVEQYGIYPFEYAEGDIFWCDLGMMQVVEEFTRYCNFISTLKVDSAIEVGVYRGRSSYFMCALLSRNNPKLKYVLVDIYDHLDSYEYYKKILPALDKRIPSTSEDYKDKHYDFVFIDADHSYDASIKDWRNIGQSAEKLVVFHDIYAHEYDSFNGGTVRMWKEVSEQFKDKNQKIFSIYPDKWMGIGCVAMN